MNVVGGYVVTDRMLQMFAAGAPEPAPSMSAFDRVMTVHLQSDLPGLRDLLRARPAPDELARDRAARQPDLRGRHGVAVDRHRRPARHDSTITGRWLVLIGRGALGRGPACTPPAGSR
jgi:hypothetical protein